ncbi:hypothetical protein NDU88_011025 [Pleurodeles waltl]|uniref:Uncharacterized protein n=1 Tax=Pleurodeles waltl TaxID=8319 RepID=A0AAV7S1A8_PLEWA|nr:hypothetical protein NDU88_011025 [Pleurodeles waltl]
MAAFKIVNRYSAQTLIIFKVPTHNEPERSTRLEQLYTSRAQRTTSRAAWCACILHAQPTAHLEQLGVCTCAIVRCTNNKKVKEKLLSMDPTLEESIQVARSMEHTATWMKEIEKSSGQIRDIDEKSTIEVKEVKMKKQE